MQISYQPLFSSQANSLEPENFQPAAFAFMDRGHAAGINFFDTAEMRARKLAARFLNDKTLARCEQVYNDILYPMG